MADANATAPIDPTAFTVTVDCGGTNGYDGRLGLRISAIFVIGFGSILGTLPSRLRLHSKEGPIAN